MEEISLNEAKLIQIEILKHFDSFCRNHNLNYSLGDGTLIGAVRHKGYIPWDDDIDVMMLRSEFDKFVKLYESEGNGKYRLTSKQYGHIHMLQTRLCDTETQCEFLNYYFKDNVNHGLFIDIIPIDHYPDSKVDQIKLLSEIRRYGLIAYLNNFSLNHLLTDFSKKCSLIKRLGLILIKILPTSMNFWREKAIKKMCQYNNVETKQLAEMEWWHHQPWVFPRKTFDSYIDLEFEGNMFMAIKDYDTFLTAQYGDYMKLPPEDKRQLHHTFKAYRK